MPSDSHRTSHFVGLHATCAESVVHANDRAWRETVVCDL
jgi:hypothetical protein